MPQLWGRRRSVSDLNRAELGALGERLSAKKLRKDGYRVLARNVETAVGEADLVCRAPDRATIVVVEVKSRVVDPAHRRANDLPELAVTHAKKRTLIGLTHALARVNNWTDRPLRIDVVAVEFADAAEPVIRHHVNAVTLDDAR